MNSSRAAGVLLAMGAALAARAQVSTDVAFTAEVDGTTQRYVQLVSRTFDSTTTHDVLIALHGAGSDRWQFATDQRDECRAAREAAGRRDMVYISPDYRASTSFMGIKADADVVQIIRDLKLRYHVGRVFICGASMGGGGCLTFTAIHPGLISGVASMNGIVNYFDWPGWEFGPITESFGGTAQQVPDEYRKRSAEFWPGNFTMPVGIAVSANDDICPPAAVLRFAAALRDSGKKFLLINDPSAGHATVYANAKAVLDFAIDSAAVATAVRGMQPLRGRNARPRVSSGRLVVTTGQTDLALRVYSLNGGLAAASIAPAMTSAIVALERQSRGTYVVRVGDGTGATQSLRMAR